MGVLGPIVLPHFDIVMSPATLEQYRLHPNLYLGRLMASSRGFLAQTVNTATQFADTPRDSRLHHVRELAWLLAANATTTIFQL